MSILAFLAEQKISQAMANSDLNSPNWKNKPLPLDDEHWIPDDLKMAYKILKNAGFVPPEIEVRKEIGRLEQLIATTEDEHLRIKQMQKLNVLMMKIESSRGRPVNIADQDEYYRQIVENISSRPPKGSSPSQNTSKK